ncbi:hypothetical protein PanWU01x14_170610, partial [Parasponia andersonii]
GIPDMLRPLVLWEIAYARTTSPDPCYFYFRFWLKVVFKVYGTNTRVKSLENAFPSLNSSPLDI